MTLLKQRLSDPRKQRNSGTSEADDLASQEATTPADRAVYLGEVNKATDVPSG